MRQSSIRYSREEVVAENGVVAAGHEVVARDFQAEAAEDASLNSQRQTAAGPLRRLPDPDVAAQSGLSLDVGLQPASTLEGERWAFGGVGAASQHIAPEDPHRERRLTDRSGRAGEVFRVRKPGVALHTLSQTNAGKEEQGEGNRQHLEPFYRQRTAPQLGLSSVFNTFPMGSTGTDTGTRSFRALDT